MRVILVILGLLLIVGTTDALARGVGRAEKPFRLYGGGSGENLSPNNQGGIGRCTANLEPDIPEGKIFVAEYVSIQVTVFSEAPQDLEGHVWVFTGFVSWEDVPSLGVLERAGDVYVLGERTRFFMTIPTEDAKDLAVVADFSAPLPEPAGFSCGARVDGHLVDAPRR